MAFEVIDQLSLPGNPDKANEDALAARPDAAVVFDGATGLGEPLLPGPSDAAWIARFGANRLMAHLGEGWDGRAALQRTLDDAKASFDGLKRREPAETWELPFASMMLACEAPAGFDAFWFGDCVALVQRPGEAAAVIGEALEKKASERARVAKLAEKSGLAPTAGVARAEFLPSLRRARNYVNTMDGAWLFGPNPEAGAHAQTLRVAAPAGSLVLLASDGFLALVSDYAAYDVDGLLAAAQGEGLGALGERLRAIEAGDPEGRQFPRFKASDDATALLLRIV